MEKVTDIEASGGAFKCSPPPLAPPTAPPFPPTVTQSTSDATLHALVLCTRPLPRTGLQRASISSITPVPAPLTSLRISAPRV